MCVKQPAIFVERMRRWKSFRLTQYLNLFKQLPLQTEISAVFLAAFENIFDLLLCKCGKCDPNCD